MSPQETLHYWMREREKIRKLKAHNHPSPWTPDPILQQYRFCNVHREHDRVTQWIRKHWQMSYIGRHVPSWWLFMVARMVNWPPTLALLKQSAFRGNTQEMMKTILAEQAKRPKKKVFGSAYIVSTNGRAMEKADYFELLWHKALDTRIVIVEDSLAATHRNLMNIDGLGSFMAAQIVADLKHDGPLVNAHDLKTWAAPGPGSMRGLARLEGMHLSSKFKPAHFLGRLNYWRIEAIHKTDIYVDAQDFQNCLCEFDKYSRALNGEGRPKTGYVSHSTEYSV